MICHVFYIVIDLLNTAEGISTDSKVKNTVFPPQQRALRALVLFRPSGLQTTKQQEDRNVH